jgi:hypothetical protein
MVDTHYALRVPATSKDKIRDLVAVELAGGRLDGPLLENIFSKFFFSTTNPWEQILVHKFDEGFSPEILGLFVTLVSNGASDISFYVSIGSQVRISLNDWSDGIFDHPTQFGPEHKEVFQKILKDLQNAEPNTTKLLSKWWETGV